MITEFMSDSSYSTNVSFLRTEEAKKAVWSEIPNFLHKDMVDTLHESGILKLYKHQSLAIKYIIEGDNTVITTGVASGKSLCYQVPIINSLCYNKDIRSLCIFPTKALTQDQKNNFEKLLTVYNEQTSSSLAVDIYDGDTAKNKRSYIRSRSSILMTNPDMLHIGILPNHIMWRDFFSHLKYIVIDEVHVYRGIFGSHFTNLLRRLRRICRHYGSSPQFVLTSATVGNTDEFISSIIEQLFRKVEFDYSPHGNRHFIIYNPPIVNQELKIRRSSLRETVRITKFFLKRKIQSLIFSSSRREVEMIVSELKLRDSDELLAGYRSGYLKRERREIEEQLKSGYLNAVVSTNALELGIDIGYLDVVIMNGYPSSIASVLQRAGRAGRTENDSIAILVAKSDLLNQYIVRNPHYIFSGTPEQALIDANNIFILMNHLKCAICELPLGKDENFYGCPEDDKKSIIEWLEKSKLVRKIRNKYYWTNSVKPANEMSLRAIGNKSYILIYKTKNIGTIDNNRAYWYAHPRAVYIHNGKPYFVADFKTEQGKIILEDHKENYYTEPLDSVSYKKIKDISDTVYVFGKAEFCILDVETQIEGFRKIDWDSRSILDYEDLDIPSTTLRTKGIILSFNESYERDIIDNGITHKHNDYGKHWKEITRMVKQRDHNICQSCGKLESTISFDVHHIKPFKSFSNAIEANQMENLITLCKSCHRKAETNVMVKSTLAGLKYLMKNLAPFYLMCSEGDISINFESECQLIENKPAIIIYDNFSGGIGLSKKLTTHIPDLLKICLEQVSKCDCDDGCPNCIGPIAEDGIGSKHSVKELLQKILSHYNDI